MPVNNCCCGGECAGCDDLPSTYTLTFDGGNWGWLETGEGKERIFIRKYKETTFPNLPGLA